MKRIILVSLFGDIESGSSRISNIYKYSSSDVLYVITSDFDHRLKKYKVQQSNTRTKYLHVTKYDKNLSFKRIFSHITFAYKLHKYLKALQKRPTTIYCAMPPSTAAYICGRYCKKYGIKFVIDVIDLWPDSLFPIVGGVTRQLLSIISFPWKYITIQAYKMADVILGESKEYTRVAASYNEKVPVYPLYLGVDKQNVTSLIKQSHLFLDKPDNEIWIGYGGSLGTSYDFKTLIEGVALLNGKVSYKLFFIGDGVCRKEILKLIKKYSVKAEITGFVAYGDFLKYLSYCDIAVNLFRDNTKVVHSYKFNDYVATNCFILNSLSGETAKMIDEYQIGLNFDFRINTFEKVLFDCVIHWDMYKHWKFNNQRFVKEILDKELIYSKLSTIL